MKRLLTFTSALLLTTSLLAQSYTIRFNPAKGSSVRHSYNIKQKVKGMPSMDTTMEFVTKTSCTAVANGIFTMTMKAESAKVTGNEQMKSGFAQIEKELKSRTTTYKMDSLGNVKSGGPNEIAGVTSSMAYPKGAVKVGQSWSSVTSVPTQLGKVSIKTTLKLLGVEAVSGVNCYKIAVTVAPNGQSNMKVNGTGTIWIRQKDGMQEKGSFNTSMVMSGQNGNAMTMTQVISFKRV